MAVIPTITFQILGPYEGAAEGSTRGLWFKLKSQPPSTEDLNVGLRFLSSNGEVKQSGVIMNLQHETHSADFFYKDLRSFLDLIKNYDENDVIISIFMGFQRAYKAPNQEINGMNAFWHSPGMNAI